MNHRRLSNAVAKYCAHRCFLSLTAMVVHASAFYRARRPHRGHPAGVSRQVDNVHAARHTADPAFLSKTWGFADLFSETQASQACW